MFPTLSGLVREPSSGLGAIYVAPIKALLNNQAGRLGKYTQMSVTGVGNSPDTPKPKCVQLEKGRQALHDWLTSGNNGDFRTRDQRLRLAVVPAEVFPVKTDVEPTCGCDYHEYKFEARVKKTTDGSTVPGNKVDPHVRFHPG